MNFEDNPPRTASTDYMPTPEQYMRSVEEVPGRTGEPIPPHPRRPRRRRRLRIGLIISLVLLTMVLVVVAYAAILATNVAKISTKPLDLSGLAADATGRTNILLLGEGDPGHAGEGLTDTI